MRKQQTDSDDIDKQLDDLEKDDRTAMDIIWPNPYKGERNPYAFPKVRDWNHLKLALQASWQDYLWTWKGFRSPGLLVPDIEEVSAAEEMKKKEKQLEQQKDDIQQNVQRNTQFVKEHAQVAQQEFQDRTGIRDKDDLRQAATDAVKVATQCVNEFLSGYRKGRDDEVENMLTKYFQEFREQHIDKKKRRRQAIL